VRARFWDESELPADTPAAIVVRNPSAIVQLVCAPGQLGLARAWVEGSLDVEGDLEDILRTRNLFAGVRISPRERVRLAWAALRAIGVRRLRPPRIPAIEARVGGRMRSLGRDRAAVRHHYDVSNRFYRWLLGPTMVYSCAHFSSPDDTLEAAEEHKLDLICRELALHRGERFLDIGCGWGSLLPPGTTR
jgi:cyclopropane-fatty-acyl-phospholipid synthase